ncbi:hypothetical protein DMA12_24465 [Amycolatopsis balhimycina DSM 5908]|uniref:Uncharacterized protein n=1 Tax=Amycolatopsis balhimycina DSM 5908 TaxID=1081091 RepID=A0A428WEE9_AMYBA|nr:hypothetical protein DMA12_24465 [Amycolatopsis balhimycina DSM 5908]
MARTHSPSGSTATAGKPPRRPVRSTSPGTRWPTPRTSRPRPRRAGPRWPPTRARSSRPPRPSRVPRTWPLESARYARRPGFRR